MNTKYHSNNKAKTILACTALVTAYLSIVLASCFSIVSALGVLFAAMPTERNQQTAFYEYASTSASVNELPDVNLIDLSSNNSSTPQVVQLCDNSIPDIMASGSCGRWVSWALDEAGVLYIWGTGDMDDFDYDKINCRPTTSSPWDSIRNEIQFVVIGDGVTSIGDQAFAYCKNLMQVEIPDSVTSIGANAFRDCDKLYYVTLPNDITKIEKNLFYHCEGLVGVTMPSSTVRIEEGAFRYCRALTDLEIPESVTKIGASAFEETSLESVIISPFCKLGYEPFPSDCVVFYR